MCRARQRSRDAARGVGSNCVGRCNNAMTQRRVWQASLVVWARTSKHGQTTKLILCDAADRMLPYLCWCPVGFLSNSSICFTLDKVVHTRETRNLRMACREADLLLCVSFRVLRTSIYDLLLYSDRAVQTRNTKKLIVSCRGTNLFLCLGCL